MEYSEFYHGSTKRGLRRTSFCSTITHIGKNWVGKNWVEKWTPDFPPYNTLPTSYRKGREGKYPPIYTPISYVANPTTRVTLNSRILISMLCFADVIRTVMSVTKGVGLPHSYVMVGFSWQSFSPALFSEFQRIPSKHIDLEKKEFTSPRKEQSTTPLGIFPVS